ncbi:MAG: DUF4143 domain-containing protein [Candidatus Methanoplasma sp.]|jgi:predicted AAA+ superfamily ATPase|nr:DUF4143 domain-containing protein [Candidatus Methanoplasma sp.]
MVDRYLKRILDSEIKEYLDSMGAILIEGPKWCGKTRTSKEFAKSILSIADPNQIKSIKLATENGLYNFLDGDTPLLIDEWQDVPEIWNAVRFEVDRRGKKGQFILTGSSVPPAEPTRHSGAGRIARVTMRPMSLFESGESDGKISLSGLFEPDGNFAGYSKLTIDGLALALTRGGWPGSLDDAPTQASRTASQYLKAVTNSDLSRVDGINKNPKIVSRIVASIARNISTYASMETIRRDVNGDEGNMADDTLKNYIAAMERIFLVENLPAWNPHTRSRTKLVTTPKWHFTDPSIATSALGKTKDALLSDYETFGPLFESLCVRDLRAYCEPMDGYVSFFRNKNGFEVDLIAERPDGRWGAIEVKLGGPEIDTAAKNLLKLKDMVDPDFMRPPSFLMVLTAGQFGYKRPDGVLVVPIGCLRD